MNKNVTKKTFFSKKNIAKNSRKKYKRKKMIFIKNLHGNLRLLHEKARKQKILKDLKKYLKKEKSQKSLTFLKKNHFSKSKSFIENKLFSFKNLPKVAY